MHIEINITYIVIPVVFAVLVLIYSLVRYRRLMALYQHEMAKVEQGNRNLNVFLHNLAAENNVTQAMASFPAWVQEELNAESVGIYIPDTGDSAGKTTLRGIACTTNFPDFTACGYAEAAPVDYNPRLYEDLNVRLSHFIQEEKVLPGVGILGQALESRKPLRYTQGESTGISALPTQCHAMMVFPLNVGDRFAGLVCVVNQLKKDAPGFTEEDMAKLGTLSATVAMANTLVLIYRDRARQERIQRELTFCQQLQETFLPPEKQKSFGDILINVAFNPCNEVSGDFYDFAPIDENRMLVMIGDATGKGIGACMQSSVCHSFILALVEHCGSLEDFMLDLNQLVRANSRSDTNVSASFIVVDKLTHKCRFARAGHKALYVAHADGRIDRYKPYGTALGMWDNDDTSFRIVEFDLEEGMKLILYTDGLTEASDKDGREYGEQRVADAFAALATSGASPRDIIKGIQEDIGKFVGDAPRADDQTLLIIAR